MPASGPNNAPAAATGRIATTDADAPTIGSARRNAAA